MSAGRFLICCGDILLAFCWTYRYHWPFPGVCDIPLLDIATGPVHHVEYPVEDGPRHVGVMSVDVMMREVAPVTITVSNIRLTVAGAPLLHPDRTILRLSYVKDGQVTVFRQLPYLEVNAVSDGKIVRHCRVVSATCSLLLAAVRADGSSALLCIHSRAHRNVCHRS